jgi:hypothetical protein
VDIQVTQAAQKHRQIEAHKKIWTFPHPTPLPNPSQNNGPKRFIVPSHWQRLLYLSQKKFFFEKCDKIEPKYSSAWTVHIHCKMLVHYVPSATSKKDLYFQTLGHVCCILSQNLFFESCDK